MAMEWLTVDQAAAMLGVGRQWIYNRVASGELPAIRVGKYVRLRPEVIEECQRSPEEPRLPWTAAYRRTYHSWADMKRRCMLPTDSDWHRYGGRGITVCDRWCDSFDAFLADMGERPEGLTLDRIDNDGNYEPGNCRYATRLEQVQNRSLQRTGK